LASCCLFECIMILSFARVWLAALNEKYEKCCEANLPNGIFISYLKHMGSYINEIKFPDKGVLKGTKGSLALSVGPF
jgi:hypothetical protein